MIEIDKFGWTVTNLFRLSPLVPIEKAKDFGANEVP